MRYSSIPKEEKSNWVTTILAKIGSFKEQTRMSALFNAIFYCIKRSVEMRSGAYKVNVALQPHHAREFASKLFL